MTKIEFSIEIGPRTVHNKMFNDLEINLPVPGNKNRRKRFDRGKKDIESNISNCPVPYNFMADNSIRFLLLTNI